MNFLLLFCVQFKSKERKKVNLLRRELVPPKMDIVFESLFKPGNEEITKALISNIICKKIQKIDLEKNKRLLREYTKDKLGILDLIATLDDGVICHIEVQLSNNKDIEERLLFYNSKIYSQQMLIGEKYKDLKKTISIAILDYNLEKLKNIEEVHTKWTIMEEKYRKTKLTDKMEIHIIELPKIRKVKTQTEKNTLIEWMKFLDNPNDGEVLEIMKTNKEMEEAMKKLEEIQSDEEMMRIIDLRKKAIWDHNQAMFVAREEGLEEGENREKIKIAKKMLEERIDIEVIQKVTGLSKEELKELKS